MNHLPLISLSSPHARPRENSHCPARFAPAGIAALFLVILIALIGAPTAQAEGDQQETHFRLLSWSETIDGLKFLNSDGKPSPAEIPLNRFSPVYDYKGPGPIVFGRTPEGAATKADFKRAAEVPIPNPPCTSFLVLFLKPTQNDEYATATIEENDGAVPPGGYRFYNFSDFPLHIKCGDLEVVVPPHASSNVQPKTTDSEQIMPVEIKAERASGLGRVYANRWPYGKTTMTQVVIFFEPESQTYILKRITQDSPSPRTHP